MFAATTSSLTAATLGYDVGIVAAAIDYISRTMHLDHGQTQLVVGSLNFVSAFGTLIAGYTSDTLGRKMTVGTIVDSLSHSSHHLSMSSMPPAFSLWLHPFRASERVPSLPRPLKPPVPPHRCGYAARFTL